MVVWQLSTLSTKIALFYVIPLLFVILPVTLTVYVPVACGLVHYIVRVAASKVIYAVI